MNDVCVIIDPIKKSDSEETTRQNIQFSSVLPPPGYTIESTNERAELAHLRNVLGWRDPRGLYGYSETSEYKDLYVYFDYGDRSSPINELATKAFKMYGLGGGGEMVYGKPTWGNIHGPVLVVRLEPGNLNPDAVHNPHFTLEEIRTLIFFRDNEVSAHKIAAKRDSARFLKSLGVTNPTAFMGPGVQNVESLIRWLDG